MQNVLLKEGDGDGGSDGDDYNKDDDHNKNYNNKNNVDSNNAKKYLKKMHIHNLFQMCWSSRNLLRILGFLGISATIPTPWEAQWSPDCGIFCSRFAISVGDTVGKSNLVLPIPKKFKQGFGGGKIGDLQQIFIRNKTV